MGGWKDVDMSEVRVDTIINIINHFLSLKHDQIIKRGSIPQKEFEV
jgi:hypothetical protein